MKAAFYTLGCKVNQYETESMREQFRQGGFDVAPDEGGADEQADVYVINTCTVTNLADRKSRQLIRKAHRLNPDAIVAVTGCYAQMDRDAVAAIEGVDIVTGTGEKSMVFKLVQDLIEKRGKQEHDGAESDHPAGPEDDQNTSDGYAAEREGRNAQDRAENTAICDVKDYDDLNKYEELGVISEMGGRTRAFIKIQEGCNRFCSYCVIPFARGKVRSRARDEIVREVSGLIGSGYREIVLTGINTALYGTDLGYGGIAPLIGAIDAIGAVESAGADTAADAAVCDQGGAEGAGESDFRIRLSSLEPTVVDADYAASLLKYKRLCHHLHLSAQSGSDSVLAAMNRHYTRDDYLEIVRRLREQDPYYGISADIIVGFPGESEKDFDDSVRLVRESELVKTHVFKYSVRRGTKAAGMPDQIDERVKAERSRILIQAAEETARAFSVKCTGQVRRVLFEQNEHGMLTGYTDNYIKVYVPAKEPQMLELKCGEFADVRLMSLYKDGMLGETAFLREI